jgi:hypothetical protein
MIDIQIIGIRKPGGAYNDHSAISHYQWRDGNGQTAIWDRMKMVNWILEAPQQHRAYVKDIAGDVAFCKVMRSPSGTLFLETRPDGTMADNLLSLPQI